MRKLLNLRAQSDLLAASTGTHKLRHCLQGIVAGVKQSQLALKFLDLGLGVAAFRSRTYSQLLAIGLNLGLGVLFFLFPLLRRPGEPLILRGVPTLRRFFSVTFTLE